MHDGSSLPSFLLNRRQFFAAFAAAMAVAELPSAHAQIPSASVGADDVARTHEALFDLWFPLSELGLPPEVEPTIAAIRSQLAAAERLDRTIADTYDRLRLLDARIDEAVTRTVELSVTQADAAIGGLSGPGGVRAELDSIVDDMEALRQAVEETRRADAGTGPPGEAGSAST